MIKYWSVFFSDTGKLLSIQDIDRVLVDIFLGEVKSDLRKKSLPAEVLYERMDLVIKYGDHKEGGKIKPTLIPRNVALLFFNRHPERHFRGAKIEITCFTQKNEVIEEKIVTGPIHQQVEDCLSYIMEKTSEEVSYLYTTYSEQALHEAVVNAVYHRSYEPDVCDPTKVHIRPDGIEIISYPGPHPSLKPEHFQDGRNISSVPERNNRIGEFLKDIGLANTQNTGVNTIWRTMKQNRVQPSFTFDASLFQVTLKSCLPIPVWTENLFFFFFCYYFFSYFMIVFFVFFALYLSPYLSLLRCRFPALFYFSSDYLVFCSYFMIAAALTKTKIIFFLFKIYFRCDNLDPSFSYLSIFLAFLQLL